MPHAVAFTLRLQQAPLNYMPETLTTAMYQRNLPMIDITSLELDIDPNYQCLAPSTRIPEVDEKREGF